MRLKYIITIISLAGLLGALSGCKNDEPPPPAPAPGVLPVSTTAPSGTPKDTGGLYQGTKEGPDQSQLPQNRVPPPNGATPPRPPGPPTANTGK